MEIEYLKQLQLNPVRFGMTRNFPIVPISAEEITALEQRYNNGNLFPKALREVLALAGAYCYVLDYGLNETQQDMQEYVRAELHDEGRVISRPFYAIDIYNALDQFLFVYLDEGDNPAVYEGHYYDSITRSDWITLVNKNLSGYIDSLIDRVQKGQNPF